MIKTKNSIIKVRPTNKSKKLYHRQAKNKKTNPTHTLEHWFVYVMYQNVLLKCYVRIEYYVCSECLYMYVHCIEILSCWLSEW